MSRGGTLRAALPDARGAIRSPALGCELSTSPGPRLELRPPDGDPIAI